MVNRTDRITLAPDVEALLQEESPQQQMVRHYLTFAEALLTGEGIDQCVNEDAQLHDLQSYGFPNGLQGMIAFREVVNTAFPDEAIFVASVRLYEAGVIAVELVATGTHQGPFMGIPATNKQVTFKIHVLDQFDSHGKLLQRWDTFEQTDLMRQLQSNT